MKNNTLKLLELIQYTKTVEETYDKMIPALKSMAIGTGGILPPDLDKYILKFKEEALKRLPEEIGKLYEQEFSDEDIQNLIDFYSSSVGKKYLQFHSKTEATVQRVSTDIITTLTLDILKDFGSVLN